MILLYQVRVSLQTVMMKRQKKNHFDLGVKFRDLRMTSNANYNSSIRQMWSIDQWHDRTSTPEKAD